MLEAAVHTTASFITLTYSDENLPEGGSLVPRDLQLFLKRLRKATPYRVRFFGVGEYGDQTQRPHYHLALFGIDGRTGVSEHWVPLGRSHPQSRERPACIVDSAWSLGHVHIGTLTLDSAQYIAKYTTKKMTKEDDERLCGRHPEFARMSLRPGIGALSAAQIADVLQCRHGWDDIQLRGDVPNVLKHGAKSLPLGAYMRRQIRRALEWEDINEPTEASVKQAQKMRALLETYLLPGEGILQLHKAKARYDAEQAQKAQQLKQRVKSLATGEL